MRRPFIVYLEALANAQPEGHCYFLIILVQRESGAPLFTDRDWWNEDPVLGATRGLWLYIKLEEKYIYVELCSAGCCSQYSVR